MYKLITLAALTSAMAAPAFAQSSVNIYGRLNVTLERIKEGDTTRTDMVNNSSRIGFKGVEDLGGGLKAGFQIEHGFSPATGAASSTFWGRQAEVNLSGSFGMIRMGTFTSEAYFATADYISMHNHDTGTSSDALYTDANGFNGARKIAYRTPAMGGFVGELAIQEANVAGDRGVDLAANYDMKNLHLGAGYSKLGDAKQVAVRAMYEMGPVVLGAYYQRDNVMGGSRNNYRLAAQYTMGATELHANVGAASDVAGLPGSSAHQLTLGVNQNLSKRTKVYAFYTRVGDDDKLKMYSKGNFNSVAFGVRHNF